MKLSCLVFLVVLMGLQAMGQYKKVRIETFSKTTHQPIFGVSASPVFTGDPAISDERGVLFINVPKGYSDSIILSHSDYYQAVTKIYHVLPGKAITVFLIPKPLNSDSSLLINNDNYKLAEGKVFHSYQGHMLDSVNVCLDENKIIGYTDSQGKFIVPVSISTDSLYLSHEGFRIMGISSLKPGSFGLVPVNPNDSDLKRAEWNNILSISPMELLRGGIGMRFERFINPENSLGMHASYYFFNKTTNILLKNDETDWAYLIEEFDGIKLAPFYRYYLKKTARGGNFIEAKPIAGYFYFAGRPDSNQEPYYFWTLGASGAWGFMTVKPKSHLTMNLTFGLQYFPMQDPRDEYFESYNTDWWYFLGPGGVLEIKFTLGGLF